MILFLGVSGSGKSLQGRTLASKIGCPWWSVGDALREDANPEIKQKIETGQFLPDNLILPVVQDHFKRLEVSQKECVIDGFPRSVGQAKWLAENVANGSVKLTAIIVLVVEDDEETFRRLRNRGRSDDTDESIRNRIREYREEISSILNVFEEHGIQVEKVDGTGSKQDVTDRVDALMLGDK